MPNINSFNYRKVRRSGYCYDAVIRSIEEPGLMVRTIVSGNGQP
jgi:hypothetical protein